MKQYCVGGIAFLLGTAVGFMVAQKLLKDRYEQIAQDEIDSVKENFRRHMTPEKDAEKTEDEEPKNVYLEKVTYQSMIENLHYVPKETKEATVVEEKSRPYVIPPSEFGMEDDYDTISLTYYADDTLCDDHDHIMGDDEIEETVGKESLSHFGEYERDAVCVRNDRLKVDYEILLDNHRTYDQVLLEKPWLMG